MKQLIAVIMLVFFTASAHCQQWTDEQLKNANTAADEYMLTEAEKEVVLYLNLCRMYPVAFVEIELKNYKGVPGVDDPNFEKYKASLAKTLATRPASLPVRLDELLYDDAKCYGKEISANKLKPHERINCMKRNYAECLYYGSGEGKHIAMQWLIDSGVESLGHRNICLLPAHKKIGIKVNTHFEFAHCAVAEFSK